MPHTLTRKLIDDHLVDGDPSSSGEIGLRIDQTLQQDATGTMVMLELEAMQIDRAKTESSVQFVDHNLLQTDYKNPDDHVFLESACRKYGIWFSRPGNGVSHPVHMERFGAPGTTLLGSDSHTCAGGALGALAMGAGGIDVAAAVAGQPFYVPAPKVMGVRLEGRLPDWVSAKDVILHVLRRHGVSGGVGKVIEYFGPGVETLSVWDRHVIANMGAELGATATIFPSDDETRRFLESQGRADAWQALASDDDAAYDEREDVDLGELEPLIAKPSSPGNVVPVEEVAGEPIYQAYLGSSANPGYRDYAVPAMMVDGRTIPRHVSFDVNPASRHILIELTESGHLAKLIRSGARIHQTGCNGCIGMGQAPATGRNSLRTVPRNFPGRSGTKEDAVFLCSPETATASAITGRITDPRELGIEYPDYAPPSDLHVLDDLLVAPSDTTDVVLEKGPNIKELPDFDAIPDTLEAPVLIKVGDDISTDEIMPAGARVLPYRSNIPDISRFVFDPVDEDYVERTKGHRDPGSIIVAGANYGQGSSREHAALAPRYLGVRVVLAKSFSRIHWQNLASFGILPLTFRAESDYDSIDQGDTLRIENTHESLTGGGTIEIQDGDRTITAEHQLTERQIDAVLAGGVINQLK